MQRGDFAQLGAGSRCRGRACSFFITGNTTACFGLGRAFMAPAAGTGRRQLLVLDRVHRLRRLEFAHGEEDAGETVATSRP